VKWTVARTRIMAMAMSRMRRRRDMTGLLVEVGFGARAGRVS
jgi:hypothetical protein